MVTKINSELLEDKVRTETIKGIEKKKLVEVLEEIVIGETFFFFEKQSDKKIKEEMGK